MSSKTNTIHLHIMGLSSTNALKLCRINLLKNKLAYCMKDLNEKLVKLKI